MFYTLRGDIRNRLGSHGWEQNWDQLRDQHGLLFSLSLHWPDAPPVWLLHQIRHRTQLRVISVEPTEPKGNSRCSYTCRPGSSSFQEAPSQRPALGYVNPPTGPLASSGATGLLPPPEQPNKDLRTDTRAPESIPFLPSFSMKSLQCICILG